MKNKKYTDKAIEVVYAELCLFLDDIIAKMHRQAFGKRKYIISFSDIIGLVEAAIEKEEVRKEGSGKSYRRG